MAIVITCTSCNSRLRVTDDLLGKRVKCPGCGFTFLAATTSPPEPEPPPLEEPPAPRRPSRSNDAIREDVPPPRPRSADRDRDLDEDEDAGSRRPARRRRDDEDDRDRFDDEDTGSRRAARRRRDDDDDDYPRRRRRSAAGDAANGPAIALMVVGGLAVTLSLLSLLGNLLLPTMVAGLPHNPNNPNDQAEMIAHAAGGVCGALLGILWGGLVLLGAARMLQRQNYGLAMTASIVAMLPCNGCCILGLPFGIWSLVVLNQPEVKDAFR
jgi:predicted Zn finger-like uncharacterized protein